MERRDALKYTAFLLGAGLSSATISAVMAGCRVDDSVDWKPTFLNEAEAGFIRELAETMLPKTKTPGAKDALVDRYLDTIRPLSFTAADNEKFKSDLSLLMKQAHQELGKEFVKSSPEQRLDWLITVDKAAFNTMQQTKDLSVDERPFYISLKEQILAGYFSSEAVAKSYFEFDPVPGTYKGCIPYEDVGRAWAI